MLCVYRQLRENMLRHVQNEFNFVKSAGDTAGPMTATYMATGSVPKKIDR